MGGANDDDDDDDDQEIDEEFNKHANIKINNSNAAKWYERGKSSILLLPYTNFVDQNLFMFLNFPKLAGVLLFVTIFRGPFLLFNKRLRSVIRHVVKSHVFFWSMIVIISINFIILCADFYPPTNDRWISSLSMAMEYILKIKYEFFVFLVIINYIFTGFYIIECFLKFYGLGPRRYFTSQFNRIDFMVRSK